MQNRTILIMLVISIFLMSFSAAEQSGGPLIGKQNECIGLPQECSSCSYVKVTTITIPNLSQISIQTNMAQDGTSYSYNFCNTSQLGTYSYCFVGDIDGTDTSACKTLTITPTGEEITTMSVAVQIFTSISTFCLFLLFLYLSSKGLKAEQISKEENPAIKFLFVGLSLVFLIAHIVITNVIIHDVLGIGSMASAYTAVMYIFFTVIILIFLYTLAKIMFWEVSVWQKSKGLK